MLFSQPAFSITYPYFANEKRAILIQTQFKKIKIGSNEAQVLNILPDPDEILDLFEPRMIKPKVVGKTYWYIIQRKQGTGSVIEKAEKLVRVSFNKKGTVIAIDHWGF